MNNNLPAAFRAPIERFPADSQVGSTTTSCPGGTQQLSSKPLPPPVAECDIVGVEVTLSRPGAPPRTLLIPNASGKPGGQTRIEVLANPRKDIAGSRPADTTQLKIVVKPFASCGASKHPTLEVRPAGGATVECAPAEGVSSSYSGPLHRSLRSWEAGLIDGQRFQIWNLLQWFWGAIGDDQTGHVDVSVGSCGARKAGGIVGGVGLSIDIYPIESYAVGLSLPPLWSGKREESSQRKQGFFVERDGIFDKGQEYRVKSQSAESQFMFRPVSGTASAASTQKVDLFGREVSVQQNHREKSAAGSTTSIDRLSIDGDMGRLDFSKKTDEARPWERLGVKLALRRNGSNLDFEAGKFLSAVLDLGQALQKFRKGLGSAVAGEASVGLTMSGELNFLVVDLTAAWQRKEQVGPLAPWNVQVSLNGKLIEASLSAKYGLTLRYTCLSVNVVEAELSATLTFSGEAAVAVTRSATVIGGTFDWAEREIPVKAELGATLGVKGTAMVLGQGVQATATAKAALELDAKFDPGQASAPPSLGGNIEFSGIKLTVTAVNTVRGTRYQSKPIELVAASTLVSGFKVGQG